MKEEPPPPPYSKPVTSPAYEAFVAHYVYWQRCKGVERPDIYQIRLTMFECVPEERQLSDRQLQRYQAEYEALVHGVDIDKIAGNEKAA